MTAPMGVMGGSRGPKGFSDIVGQDLVVATLRSRLRETRKLGRHLTFAGPQGAGKRTLARMYAQALVCEARLEDGSPCMRCAECLAIQRDSSFAYVEIDAAVQGDDETIRILVERDALLNTAGVRVVVIGNAERLTQSGADAALKTLERETRSIFLFLVNDLGSFSGALRSRCHVFRIGLAEAAALEEYLVSLCDKRQVAYEQPALRIIVRQSNRLTGLAIAMLSDMSNCGAVTLKNVRAALGLGWGPNMVRCWQALLGARFDEAVSSFERVALDSPGRIRAMQAFLYELVLRDENPLGGVSGDPGLDLIADDTWTAMARSWDKFAGQRSSNGKAMRAEALAWWSTVELDAPSAVAFRRGYEWLHAHKMQAQIAEMDW